MSTLENSNTPDTTASDGSTDKASDTTEHEDLLEGLDPETAYHDEVLEDEVALGGTPAGRATNEALRSIARTARSFLIYDTRNAPDCFCNLPRPSRRRWNSQMRLPLY